MALTSLEERLRGLSSVFGTRDSWAVSLGIAALAIGALGSVVLAESPRAQFLAAISLVAWAAVRLAIMAAVLRVPSRSIAHDWALGSLVWAIAFTPTLRIAAWFVSGCITLALLVHSGRSTRDAGRAVIAGWGAEALVVIGVIAIRNALVIVQLLN
jgi:hypothetical protein